MDVHDVGDYKVGNEWRFLEPGMVTTVEPGIYITAEVTSRRSGGTSESESKTTLQ